MSRERARGAPTEAGADRGRAPARGPQRPQREAVDHGEGPLLVLAGAGSGKTRVLTHRIAYLLATGAGAAERDPRDHLHQQGGERDARAGRRAGRRASSRAMWVMTFHSACARILRADAERLGYTRALHDLRRGRLAADGEALPRRARGRPEALPAARDPGADLRRQEPARRRRRPTPRRQGTVFEETRRRRLRALREADARGQRDGLRRPAGPHGQPARAVRGRPRALPPRPSAGSSSTSTRTPTTPSTGCCSCSPASTAT